MKNVKFSLVLPCYNEAEHFTQSSQRILNVLKNNQSDFEIIFVDDKSKDGTLKLISKFVEKHQQDNIRVISHAQNQGRGKTVSDGIFAAHGKHVGFIDIDCEVSPDFIPIFIQKLEEGYDVVCGQRIYSTDVSGLTRAIASKAYSYLVKKLLCVKTPDTEAGYKFFRRAKILPVVKQVQDVGWFWDTEIIARSELAGLKIASIPVAFIRRQDKTSTVHLVSDTVSYLIKLWRFRKVLRKPSL